MESVTDLIQQLNSGDIPSRVRAAERLLGLGPEAGAAAAVLAAAAGDDEEVVREAAVGALESLEATPVSLLSDFIHLLDSANPDVAYWSATLIGRLGADASAATPALAKVVGDASRPSVQERGAWALGRIGPEAKAALPALENCAANPSSRLARLCREAIARINS